jgi:hypothetical protein
LRETEGAITFIAGGAAGACCTGFKEGGERGGLRGGGDGFVRGAEGDYGVVS